MGGPGSSGRTAESSCSCKVGRSLAAYGRADLATALAERRGDGASLRDLEGVVNRAILQGALSGAGARVVGDVESVYEALTDDDVTAGRGTEVRRNLAGAGVDIDRLSDAFVSYGTVRTHLQECLDADTDRSTALSTEAARGTIEWARARSEGVIDRTIDRLEAADGVVAGDVEITHFVRVSCSACGGTSPIDDFVDRGGCNCRSDAE